uniref:C2H2-type domain-containing protein n=2 Tax=Lotharella globosa TaxID=91324 RepID=A0A6V3P2S0_9EUKA
MIRKWEQSHVNKFDTGNVWSLMTRSQVSEIATSFRAFFEKFIMKTQFEGVELWVEDDGILRNAHTIVAKGLEDWCEGNKKVTFKPGEGLVGRVCEVKSSEGLVEQQLLCSLKFKRAVLAQKCGVRTVLGVNARLNELSHRFIGIRGVVAFFSRDSIAMGKELFELVESYVDQWRKAQFSGMLNKRSEDNRNPRSLNALPVEELLPDHYRPVKFIRGSESSPSPTLKPKQGTPTHSHSRDVVSVLAPEHAGLNSDTTQHDHHQPSLQQPAREVESNPHQNTTLQRPQYHSHALHSARPQQALRPSVQQVAPFPQRLPQRRGIQRGPLTQTHSKQMRQPQVIPQSYSSGSMHPSHVVSSGSINPHFSQRPMTYMHGQRVATPDYTTSSTHSASIPVPHQGMVGRVFPQSGNPQHPYSHANQIAGAKRKLEPQNSANGQIAAEGHEVEKKIRQDAAELARKTNNLSKGLEFLLFRGSRARGPLRHQCEYCGKSFPKKGNWRAHLRVHTQEKPFACQVCGKKFSQKSNMKRHAKVHDRR